MHVRMAADDQWRSESIKEFARAALPASNRVKHHSRFAASRGKKKQPPCPAVNFEAKCSRPKLINNCSCIQDQLLCRPADNGPIRSGQRLVPCLPSVPNTATSHCQRCIGPGSLDPANTRVFHVDRTRKHIAPDHYMVYFCWESPGARSPDGEVTVNIVDCSDSHERDTFSPRGAILAVGCRNTPAKLTCQI